MMGGFQTGKTLMTRQNIRSSIVPPFPSFELIADVYTTERLPTAPLTTNSR